MKRFFLSLVVAATVGFIALMAVHHEKPLATWHRVTGFVTTLLQSEARPVGTPVPPIPEKLEPALKEEPEAPPPEPELMPLPEPATPQPSPVPESAPVVWLLEHKDYWPRTVTLTEPCEFPILADGQAVGTVRQPAGTIVSVRGIDATHVSATYLRTSARIPIDSTNLVALASAAMARQAAVSAPPAPRFTFASDRVKIDYLDCLRLGDANSEKRHGLTSFDLTKSEVYTGQLGLPARRFLPDPLNPYQGAYPGIYGGEISFVMKVDGTRQNYLTIKVSGDETYPGRLLLDIDGKEVAIRHSNDILFEQRDHPVCPGAFFYRTVPLPRMLTDGKPRVVARVRATGRFYLYGKPHQFETYQRVMEAKTGGLYRVYTHTNPLFSLPADDLQGKRPSYAEAPRRTRDDLAALKAKLIARIDDHIRDLLKRHGDIAPHNNNNFNEVELLGVAYHTPGFVSYHNPDVVRAIRDAVDTAVVNRNNGKYPVGFSWGGAYGRPGYAVFRVYDQLDGLDDPVDLGAGASSGPGAGKTRRAQWIEILKESFEFGGTHRKTITNQEIEVAMSVYGAALGLSKLDPQTYGHYPEVAAHLILESVGIEAFSGSIVLGSDQPHLGDPKDSGFGAGYYFMTPKGTSHEPMWVSACCYGNLGSKISEMYEMTKADPAVTRDGPGQGDQRIMETGRRHNLIQTAFSYPGVDTDGFRSMLVEGAICGRNTYVPGKVFYGMECAAAEANDPAGLGYLRQMSDDGQFFRDSDTTLRHTHVLFLPAAFDAVARSTSTIKIPTTPGEPDSVTADEKNAVIAIKHGDELLFVRLFGHAQTMAYAHYLCPTHERIINLQTDTTEFYPSGKTLTVGAGVGGPWAGEPPERPVYAWAGYKEELPSYDHSNHTHGNRQLLDFYQTRIGDYLIAMNTTDDLTKTAKLPPELVGTTANELVTRKPLRLSATVPVPPATTLVLHVPNTSAGAPVALPSTSDGVLPSGKALLAAAIRETDQLVTDPNTIQSLSLTKTNGDKHRLLADTVRSLASARYYYESKEASPGEIDSARAELDQLLGQVKAALQ